MIIWLQKLSERVQKLKKQQTTTKNTDDDALTRKLHEVISKLTMPEKMKARDLLEQLHVQQLAAAAAAARSSVGHIRRLFKGKSQDLGEAARRLISVRRILTVGPDEAFKVAKSEVDAKLAEAQDGEATPVDGANAQKAATQPAAATVEAETSADESWHKPVDVWERVDGTAVALLTFFTVFLVFLVFLPLLLNLLSRFPFIFVYTFLCLLNIFCPHFFLGMFNI